MEEKIAEKDSTLEEVLRFTPEVGYNVCGIDDYELPGEKLYLVKRCPTLKIAKFYLKKYFGEMEDQQRRGEGAPDDAWIYGRKDAPDEEIKEFLKKTPLEEVVELAAEYGKRDT